MIYRNWNLDRDQYFAGTVQERAGERGDNIRDVPANAEHWFEMRGCTRCKAVRYFIDTTGWTPNYTCRAREFAEAATTA